ncbi:carbonic anhydrase 7-like [Plodia interpunctella]|uniref:carbonic anhydrase 7-like n=1 Tax=Plodia interpunctella TaxID=58824 RepID=UPI002368B2F4|nr:carbonic anhydrase 7-like [Plodia interpunctella]
MFNAWGIAQIFFCCCVFIGCPVTSNYVDTQDQTSPRANTLSDDADDIQRQLENEAKDRLKYGRPKTIWVFHLPTRYPFFTPTEPGFGDQDFHLNKFEKRFLKKHKTTPKDEPKNVTEFLMEDWIYQEQANWSAKYPNCGGRSQSPVNLPAKGLIKAKARKLAFINYDAVPISLTLQNDGKRAILFGEWNRHFRPMVYGGAAYSRRYFFHSLVIHWPSEHSISSMQFPVETQLLHISAEYENFNDAVKKSSSDPLAFLGVVNIYKFSNQTHPGVEELIKSSVNTGFTNVTLAPKPLSFYSPPFEHYACYQGSLTTPPCTESVLWIVRAEALPVNRDEFNVPYGLCNTYGEPDVKPFRLVNPLNDRLVYHFQ